MRSMIVMLVISLILVACNFNNEKENDMKEQIALLNQQLNSSYKPAYGEIMESIQKYHAKLWFAGKSKNWKLAKFELHELYESLENIEKYQKERVENEHITMLYSVLDSIEVVLNEQDLLAFESSFHSLTNVCNFCHKLTNYEYIRISIPKAPPLSNQIFSSSGIQ